MKCNTALSYSYILLYGLTHTGPTRFHEIYIRGQFVEGDDVCKGILLTKQVNLVSWLCVSYCYDHIENNLLVIFFSTTMEYSLCNENT